MRLVDVDELGVGRCSKDVLPAAYCAGWNGLLGLIEKAPTVDAVVVVRCKNCRSYNKPKTGWCEVHLDREHPDDFCSYGERKDGED
mgnify:FL=1|jgi:hypothetical protein